MRNCCICNSACAKTEWIVQVCHQCIDDYLDRIDPSIIGKITEAAYEAGRASVLGTKLEPDDEVEKGMR